jgi:hypothetical protein
MLRENVDRVRASIEASNVPGFDIDAWLDEFYDPEIEWHDLPILPNAGVHVGRDALRRHVAGYLEAWAEATFSIDEIGAVGERVVVRGQYGGTGRGSGAHVHGEMGFPTSTSVYDLRAGRIVRVRQFTSHEEALAAASP